MKRENLFELGVGLNQFVITQKDLGTTSSIIPLLNLPEGLKIKNIFMNVVQPFKSTLAPNQSSIDSCVKYRLMFGSQEDTQELLSYSDEAADIGESSSNTGSYFNSPLSKSVTSKVNVESWIVPRVWTIGANMDIAKYFLGGAGTQTAGLSFGGTDGANKNRTQRYDGTTWSGTSNMLSPMAFQASCGTQDAALSIGGATTNVTEEWGGSTWTTGGNISANRYYHVGSGSQNAALLFTGWTGSTQVSIAEEYNGAAWTVVNNSNYESYASSGCGTQSATLCSHGYDGNYMGTAEEYNGSTWSISSDPIILKTSSTLAGLQNSAISCSGYIASNTCTHTSEEYDGISWKVSNSLNVAKYGLASAGSQSAALTFGGSEGVINYLWMSEEYTDVDMNEVSLSGEMILNITVI